MAQHKQLTWTELRVGLFVLAGTVLLAVVIFYVTGAGGALGPKYRLHTFLPEVDGLTVGAPVRVDGVDVGNVERIVIAVPKPGVVTLKDRNIEVDMRIQTSAQTYIRADSAASLITEGLLGNRYVHIDRGYVGRVLVNDDEIPGREEKALKQVVERSADLMDSLGSIAKQASSVLEDVRQGRGSLGKLVYDPGIHESAKRLIDNSNALLTDVRAGKGTLGKLTTDDSLFVQYKQVGENLSSATAKLNSNEATMGKFFDDPKFYDNFTGLAGDMRLLVGDFRKDPKKFLHVKFSIF